MSKKYQLGRLKRKYVVGGLVVDEHHEIWTIESVEPDMVTIKNANGDLKNVTDKFAELVWC